MRTIFFTGKGDEGESYVGDHKTPKDDILFYVLGSLDELNSWLGFCRAEAERSKVLDTHLALKNIQETLFIAQAEIYAGFDEDAAIKVKRITPEKVAFLEEIIKKVDGTLPKINKFIIPGGSELAARLDVARALARRAERLAVSLGRERGVSPDLLRYLNRLSSALFALARFVNFKTNFKEDNPTYL
ncbi:cob(I)yrinic acid a,c-diamide adenosyltransferase [Candidatus Giovannonibacteria bacterium]|nr:cob(I)yrinic acid a,c-diamide adenosyltransferase [Candidatus Giovannonibacteria bacterium]